MPALGTQQPIVESSPEQRHTCDGCSGDGQYFRGHIENGVRKGFIGRCFRCGGKGWQNDADLKRNRYYDSHVRRFD